MKQCIICNHIYNDESLSYCLKDGGVLSAPFGSQDTLIMPNPPAAKSSNKTEVIINLWYIIDSGTGAIYRLAGRAYVAEGTDQEKTWLLKRLAKTDYLAAKHLPVPKRFKVMVNEEIREGYAFPQDIDNPALGLFEDVFKQLELELPDVAMFDNEEGRIVKVGIPKDPLRVVTALIEDRYGNLIPRI